ncbi:MAG: LicD family protein [Erysipelotrichales bacterium]|nr:LicD family protein [Erysipelotrichales bacterium]
MNELQQKELDLLKEFTEFCKLHNLTYFLIGGTLLGAIRHSGFIPWDDDIDVGMPRPDYDMFCELAEKHFIGDTFFQSYRSDKHYPYVFSKLRNSNTTFIEKIYKHVPMNHGVYIDIFPIDGISKNANEKKKKMDRRVMIKAIPFFISWPVNLMRKPRLKFFLTDILIDILLCPFLLFNINNWSKRLYEKSMKKIKISESTYVANMQCGDYRNKKNIYPTYLLDEYVDWQFEDLICKVPKNYDEFLTLSYGDYMKLPPLSEQVGHHYNSGYDMHKSYRDYKK